MMQHESISVDNEILSSQSYLPNKPIDSELLIKITSNRLNEVLYDVIGRYFS